jgi:radical SAM superfamily enzyme YgiQ (UPF0313 family)
VSVQEQNFDHTVDNFIAGHMNLCWSSNDRINTFFAQIRELCPGIKIICGGARTGDIYSLARTVDVSEYSLKDQIDRWLIGWGDRAVADLIENWDRYEPEIINGFKFINVGKYPQWPKYDIPLSPFTKKDVIQEHEMLPLETSRGCAFNCRFCHYDKGFSHKLSKEDIRAQLMYYHDTFGTYKYNLTTDCFNDNYDHVKGFYEVVKSLPYKPIFTSYARADLCNKYPDVIDMMCESGFKVLQVGVESLTYEVAKASGRGLPTEKTIDILQEFKDRGVSIVGNFIIGLPGETKRSQRKQFMWARQQDILNPRFRVLNVYPAFDDIQKVSNYPDYSLDPKRYGFVEFRFDPEMYWKHQTMDLDEAKELHREWREEWRTGEDIGAQSYRNEISLEGMDTSEYLKGYYDRLVS